MASYIYAGTNRLAMVKPDGSIYYYHNDHLGTPLAMTDSGGNTVWKVAYDPFGKAQVDSASTVINNFRFPGQYYDEETGLHYNWHRYYDPGSGRYLTADPIGMIEESNLYVYVKNNPNTFIDPKGLKGCGPGSGFKEWIIPDYPFGLNFLKCCNQHDDCYGCKGKALGKNRRDCDLEFCKCLIKVYISEGGYLLPSGPITPIAYCVAVIGLGEDAFNSARQCCP
jgi:RHS repeat-associated protein